MATIQWDEVGKRFYETGVDRGVLYVQGRSGAYEKGVPWNGLTSVAENPSGGEASAQYADNIKYLNLISAEEFGCTIQAFTYPEEFGICDGSAMPTKGVHLGQQPRRSFGFSWRTLVGNDVEGSEHAYKIHLVYGAMAAPSEKSYQTVNDSPEAMNFSWSVTTTPVAVKGFKPTAHVTIDTRVLAPEKLEEIEAQLYGDETNEPTLPMPDEVVALAGVVEEPEG